MLHVSGQKWFACSAQSFQHEKSNALYLDSELIKKTFFCQNVYTWFYLIKYFKCYLCLEQFDFEIKGE